MRPSLLILRCSTSLSFCHISCSHPQWLLRRVFNPKFLESWIGQRSTPWSKYMPVITGAWRLSSSFCCHWFPPTTFWRWWFQGPWVAEMSHWCRGFFLAHYPLPQHVFLLVEVALSSPFSCEVLDHLKLAPFKLHQMIGGFSCVLHSMAACLAKVQLGACWLDWPQILSNS